MDKHNEDKIRDHDEELFHSLDKKRRFDYNYNLDGVV